MLHNPMLKVLNYYPNDSFGIGRMGENITICILSLERAPLTIKLLESFQTHMPYFEGKFLIIDNGSSSKTLEIIKQYIQTSLQNIALIEAKTNLGVAGGRNYAIQFITTEWVMFLDNDIYIDGSFLPHIHDEINLLGVHFISFPLKNSNGTYFAKGGSLSISIQNAASELHISGGGTNLSLQKPGISSFLFGGAAIVKKDTFKNLGMFNQNAFVGFEDTEFSIRLWQSGYKVGYSTVNCFIHDHGVSKDPDDIAYEKIRHAYLQIYQSANSFMLKHYLNFLSNHTIAWLHSRLAKYDNEHQNPSFQLISTKNECKKEISKKLRVAIIVDTIDWAFANIAFNLLQLEQQIFDFIVIPATDAQSFQGNLLRVILAVENCQIIHFMWRSHLFNIFKKLHDSCLDTQQIIENYLSNKIISTCVYDHLMLPSSDSFILNSFRKLVKNHYYVSSKRLFDIYSNMNGIDKPRDICSDGVDLKLFTLKDSYKFNHEKLKKKTINIGWSGNSKWGKKDHKGLHTIIKPMIQKLQQEGYSVQLLIADRNIKMIQQYEMPNFYHSLDLYVCASIDEGTPNPILEAMACGLVIVTTDVGIVREALGKLQQDFIVNRTIDDFYTKIKYLLNNLPLWEALSNENLESIKKWDWRLQSEKLIGYFIQLAEDNVQNK